MIFLIATDGSIDMIVYKVEGPRSNFGGISSISSMGNPKDFEWLRNRTKPTARQISISKSLTESMVKQNLCWTGHFIPPPPTENASNTLSFERGPWGERGPGRAARARAKMASILRPFWRARAARPGPHSPWGPLSREIFIKWPVQVKPLKKQNLCWTGHFIPPPQTENASIKWPVQVKPLKKQNLCWTGHFIPPPPTENASIKWPVQVKPLKKQNLCWTGHFIPPPQTENASIKWPVQVKPLKKQNLCWTGHFIPPPQTENASIKWPVQVKPLKKQNLCWTGHFIPPPPTENASIKWPVQVKPLKKQNLCLDWPLYTPSPNRECLYKVASPGKTPEKTESMFGLATLYPLPQQRMPL